MFLYICVMFSSHRCAGRRSSVRYVCGEEDVVMDGTTGSGFVTSRGSYGLGFACVLVVRGRCWTRSRGCDGDLLCM